MSEVSLDASPMVETKCLCPCPRRTLCYERVCRRLTLTVHRGDRDCCSSTNAKSLARAKGCSFSRFKRLVGLAGHRGLEVQKGDLWRR